MHKLVAMALVGVLAALGGSTSAAQSGNPAAAASIARSYDVGAFDEVSMVGPHHVTISVGSGHSVRAEGPRDTLERTEVEVRDGRLRIRPVEEDRWHRGGRKRQDWADYRPATFRVTLPCISGASLAGGGDMRIDRVEGGRFSASVAGSGELNVASLRVDDARFSVAGSGDLVARGTARQSRVSIAGSGNLRAREVRSDEASVSIAGSGNAELTVEDHARISIVGSGDVEIAGPARCSVSRIGGGRVRCRGEDVVG